MGQYYYPVSIDRMEYVHSHDYDNGLKLMEHSYIGNQLMNAVESLLSPNSDWYKTKLVWAGDYADPENNEEKNLHTIVFERETKRTPKSIGGDGYRFIINHTKKQYVDKRKIKKDDKGYRIHPLSLLTAEGNGRGGGDFRGKDTRIGTWARDIISVDIVFPEGYTEINGQFKEE